MADELDAGTLDFAHQMFELAREGQTEQITAYVDQGLPVNLTNDKGDTLLILAAYYNHPETVAALLERGADTGRLNDRGQSALAAAVFRSSERTVLALLAAGADAAAGKPSALEMAQYFELPEMSALLTGERG